jgi:XTP/dITP diphosphohydrolase
VKQVVLATSNPGKTREIQALLAPLGFEIVPQARFEIAEAEEPHSTFIENALAKARHACALSGLPALAEDSGICVAALSGAPGVHSARFAGEPRSDTRNNARLLEAIGDTQNRAAYYCCVMAFMRHAQDPQPLIAQGEWHGEILRAPRGSGGFGYDPLFLDPALGRTGAELTIDEKNRVSHRGKALTSLVEQLRRLQNTLRSAITPNAAMIPPET